MTSYSGLPSRALARVDLPEPLGPIRAWTSPAADREVDAPQDLRCLGGRRTCRSSISNSGACGRRSPGQCISTTADSGNSGGRSERRSAVVPEVFLPGPEALVGRAARPVAPARAVGVEAEGEGPLEVVGGDGQVAGVGAAGGAGPPEQPAADAALVERLRAGPRSSPRSQQARRAPRPRPWPGCCGRGWAWAGGRRCGRASGRSDARRRWSPAPVDPLLEVGLLAPIVVSSPWPGRTSVSAGRVKRRRSIDSMIGRSRRPGSRCCPGRRGRGCRR